MTQKQQLDSREFGLALDSESLYLYYKVAAMDSDYEMEDEEECEPIFEEGVARLVETVKQGWVPNTIATVQLTVHVALPPQQGSELDIVCKVAAIVLNCWYCGPHLA